MFVISSSLRRSCHLKKAIPYYSLLQNCFVSAAKPRVKVVKNEAIPFNELRLIMVDEEGKSTAEVMTKMEALKLSRSLNLDVILVNSKETPPICRLDSADSYVQRIVEKEDIQKKKSKSRTMKEISIGATIDPHDLQIKMRKVSEFLDDLHPVRLSIFASKKIMEKKPLAIDETTLKVLDYLERLLTGSVMPSSKSHDRIDFTLYPKPRPPNTETATTSTPTPTPAPTTQSKKKSKSSESPSTTPSS